MGIKADTLVKKEEGHNIPYNLKKNDVPVSKKSEM